MFEIINNYNKDILEYDILYNYVKFVCDKEGLSDCIFNIVLVDNDYIKRLNRDYRNIDKVTDVISFALEDSDNDYDSVIRVLGDIYISVDMAYYQANLYNHSSIRELCFLATHGILHLLGFDHQTEEDYNFIIDLQNKALESIGYDKV